MGTVKLTKSGRDDPCWTGCLPPARRQPLSTVGVFLFAALSYYVFYYLGFVHWGIGNEHAANLEHAFPEGESLAWNSWWIISLLWNEWFFHKWPFYVHEPSAS